MICRALESLMSLDLLPWTASNMNPLSSPSKPAWRLQVDLPGHGEAQIPSSPPRMQQHNLSPQKNLPKSPMKTKASLIVAQIYLITPDHIAVRSPFNLVSLIIRYSTGGSTLSFLEQCQESLGLNHVFKFVALYVYTSLYNFVVIMNQFKRMESIIVVFDSINS